jgi:hypothetical protein
LSQLPIFSFLFFLPHALGSPDAATVSAAGEPPPVRPGEPSPNPTAPGRLLLPRTSHTISSHLRPAISPTMARLPVPGAACGPRRDWLPWRSALLPTNAMGLLDQGTAASPSLVRVDLPTRRGSPPQLLTMLRRCGPTPARSARWPCSGAQPARRGGLLPDVASCCGEKNIEENDKWDPHVMDR